MDGSAAAAMAGAGSPGFFRGFGVVSVPFRAFPALAWPVGTYGLSRGSPEIPNLQMRLHGNPAGMWFERAGRHHLRKSVPDTKSNFRAVTYLFNLLLRDASGTAGSDIVHPEPRHPQQPGALPSPNARCGPRPSTGEPRADAGNGRQPRAVTTAHPTTPYGGAGTISGSSPCSASPAYRPRFSRARRMNSAASPPCRMAAGSR